MRVAFRGFVQGRQAFEEIVSIPANRRAEGRLIAKLADKHSSYMAVFPRHVMEIEFLDDPDSDERFFRFGTDPTGMVSPCHVDLKTWLKTKGRI